MWLFLKAQNTLHNIVLFSSSTLICNTLFGETDMSARTVKGIYTTKNSVVVMASLLDLVSTVEGKC